MHSGCYGLGLPPATQAHSTLLSGCVYLSIYQAAGVLYIFFYVWLIMHSNLFDIFVYMYTLSVNMYTFIDIVLHLDLHLFLFLHLDIIQRVCVHVCFCFKLHYIQLCPACVYMCNKCMQYIIMSCGCVYALYPFMREVRRCVVTLGVHLDNGMKMYSN